MMWYSYLLQLLIYCIECSWRARGHSRQGTELSSAPLEIHFDGAELGRLLRVETRSILDAVLSVSSAGKLPAHNLVERKLALIRGARHHFMKRRDLASSQVETGMRAT